jgi:hypothetical protein
MSKKNLYSTYYQKIISIFVIFQNLMTIALIKEL